MAPPALRIPMSVPMDNFRRDMENARNISGQGARFILQQFLRMNAAIQADMRVTAGTIALLGAPQTVLKAAAGAVAIKVAWVAGAALIAVAIKQALAAFEEFITIGEKAGKIGVSTTFFQSFVKQADVAKLKVEEMERALEHARDAVRETFGGGQNAVATRLQEFFTSGFFRGNESSVIDRFFGTRDLENKTRIILESMAMLEQRGERLASADLASKFFGADIANRIRDASLSTQELIDRLDKIKAEDLIKASDIERASELKRRYEEAVKNIEKLLQTQISLAAVGTELWNVWVNIVELIGTAAKHADRLNTTIQKMVGVNWFSTLPVVGPMIVGRQAISRGTEIQGSVDEGVSFPGEPGFRRGIPMPRPRPLSAFLAEEKAAKDAAEESAEAAKKRLDHVETYLVRLERVNEELKIAIRFEGEINAERGAALALVRAEAEAKRAARKLTEEEIEKIKKLGAEQGALQAQQKNLQQSLRETANAWRYFGDIAIDVLEDLKIDSQDLDRVLKSLTRSMLQALITGQGPLAFILGTAPQASAGPNAIGGILGMLSTAFGGGRAGGGSVDVGRVYAVGERGPELFAPRTPGMIIPNDIARRVGGVTVSPIYNIDASGADPAAISRMERALINTNRQLEQQGRAMVSQGHFGRTGVMR